MKAENNKIILMPKQSCIILKALLYRQAERHMWSNVSPLTQVGFRPLDHDWKGTNHQVEFGIKTLPSPKPRSLQSEHIQQVLTEHPQWG